MTDETSPIRDRAVLVRPLGLTDYAEVHRMQAHLQTERRERRSEDVLLLTEHRPVITLGRNHPAASLRVPPEAVTRAGIPILQTERGGDITYHGPGQLVAYGIIDLRSWQIGPVDYVTGLEEAVITTLAGFGLPASRDARARGVWTGGRKIASVGVHVRGGVSMHGVAVNVDSDLSGFELINPCGMPGVEMTSIAREVGRVAAVSEVARDFAAAFGRTFSCRLLGSDERWPVTAASSPAWGP